MPRLVRGIAATDLSYAVIAARTFLENLLLPMVINGVQSEGVLRYPLRADFPVSWVSHLDVADVAVALFERRGVLGTVAVGQYPPITGPELAEAFSDRLGRRVTYEAQTPEQFGAMIAPLIGEGVAAVSIKRYSGLATLSEFSFDPSQSVQKLLNITPRTTSQWLADMKI